MFKDTFDLLNQQGLPRLYISSYVIFDIFDFPQNVYFIRVNTIIDKVT